MQPLELRCLIPVYDLCQMIKQSAIENSLEGITFLGGEPMLQAAKLAMVAKFAHEQGLSVITFTGATLSECTEENYPGSNMLLAHTDVLIDGDFRQDCIDETRNWIGSTNQVFHYFTNRYDSSIETDKRYHGLIELRVLETTVTFNGCPKSLSELKN
jgi:anaerobic ribonucleoside-triphosphate reductase activating protein